MKTLRIFSFCFVLAALLTLPRISPILSVPVASAQGYDPVTHGTDIVNQTVVHWVRVPLNAPNTLVYPMGAQNHLPKYNANDPEPRWDDNNDHTQSILPMYNGAPFTDKVAMINTDYFCAAGCAGDAGAPQGLFIQLGIKYQWTGSFPPPQPQKVRSALVINNGYKGSIRVYGPLNPPDNNSQTATLRHVASGGPILVWGGVRNFNPFGETGDHVAQHMTKIMRSGACVTPDANTLWLFATETPIGWKPWASNMISKGCDRGMDFDGGGSPAMVWQGSYVVPHTRAVGTGLLIRDQGPDGLKGRSKFKVEESLKSGE